MRAIIFARRLAWYVRESWRVENALERFFCEMHPWGISGVGYRRKLTYRRMAWWRKLPANIRAAWRDAFYARGKDE